MNVLENVINKLEGVSQQGNSYQALCPAHDDKKPSLSIATGDDGRVLLHCHAGCKTEDIVKELGLEMKDLFICCKIKIPKVASQKSIMLQLEIP